MSTAREIRTARAMSAGQARWDAMTPDDDDDSYRQSNRRADMSRLTPADFERFAPLPGVVSAEERAELYRMSDAIQGELRNEREAHAHLCSRCESAFTQCVTPQACAVAERASGSREIPRWLLAAMLALAIAAVTLFAPGANAAAGWNSPGADRFSGDIPAAVHDYVDIPPATRNALQARMERHDYDDRVTITRDSIVGLWGYVYEPQITGMHYGSKGRMLAVAARDRWPDGMTIEALAYTEGGFTVIVPSICGNVARVVRLPATPVASAASAAGGAMPGGGYSISAPVAWPAFAPPTESTVVVYEPPAFGLLAYPWRPGITACCAPPIVSPPLPMVPEPAAWAMFAAGAAAVRAIVSRSNRKERS